jgi:hypothetical protein
LAHAVIAVKFLSMMRAIMGVAVLVPIGVGLTGFAAQSLLFRHAALCSAILTPMGSLPTMTTA